MKLAREIFARYGYRIRTPILKTIFYPYGGTSDVVTKEMYDLKTRAIVRGTAPEVRLHGPSYVVSCTALNMSSPTVTLQNLFYERRSLVGKSPPDRVSIGATIQPLMLKFHGAAVLSWLLVARASNRRRSETRAPTVSTDRYLKPHYDELSGLWNA